MMTKKRPRGPKSKYSEAFIARLRELIGKHYSGSECAYILGREFKVYLTRNAIRGLASRNHIQPPEDKQTPKTKRPAKPKRPGTYGAGTLVKRGSSHFTIAYGYPGHNEPPKARADFPYRCDIMGLTSTACRYPLGEPGTAGFFYCGAPEADNPFRPYCRYHETVAYAPPARRI